MKSSFTAAVLLLCLAAIAAGAELVTLHPGNFQAYAPVGKEADAIYGDYCLRNDRIVAVVTDPTLTRGRSSGRKTGHLQPVGLLIDLTRRDEPNDLLGLYGPAFRGSAQRTYLVAAGDPGEPTRQGAFVDEATAYQNPGREPRSAKRMVLTIPYREPGREVRYILEDGWDYLQVETEYRHTDKSPVTLSPTTVLSLGPMNLSEPQVLVGGWEHASIVFAYDPWFGQAYAMQAVDHEAEMTSIPVRGYWLAQKATGDLAERKLPANESLVITKRLVPGRDAFQVMAIALKAAGQALEPLRITVRNDAGVEANVLVKAYRGKELFAAGRTDQRGMIDARVPAGTYRLVIEPAGREAQEIQVDVPSDEPIEAVFPSAAMVQVNVTDANGKGLPCKVEFRGVGDTRDPFFFPNSGEEQVQNLHYTADGAFTQILPPGEYEVWFSHGPEYDIATRKLTIEPGQHAKLQVKLTRQLDTSGWISADFGNRSTLSMGSSVASPKGRVLNLLAENIEFAPATEDDQVYTYAHELEALNATQRMTTCPGIHLTERVRKAVTSQNSFPLIYKPHYQDGGAWQRPQHVLQVFWLNGWYSPLTPSNHVNYMAGNEKLIQVTPPDIWENDGKWHGMWMLFGGLEQPGAYARHEETDRNSRIPEVKLYDAMELQPLQDFLSLPAFDPTDPDGLKDQAAWYQEMNEWSRTKNWPHLKSPNVWWLRILNQGWRITGVVNSNAYNNFHGSGAWRSYINVGYDDPARIDPLDVVRAVQAGKVIMSSGPFMQVTLRPVGADMDQAVGPGGDLSARDGKAVLHVKVQSAAGTRIDKVQVLFNGKPVSKLTHTRDNNATDFHDGVVQFEADIPLQMPVDTRVIVLASGTGPNLRGVREAQRPAPRRGAPLPRRELVPTLPQIAMSNPIYVDVNGDGFRPFAPWRDRVATRIDNKTPLRSDPDAEPARLELQLCNVGTEPAADTLRIEIHPDDAADIVGQDTFSYQLAPGELKTIQFAVKLRTPVRVKAIRVGVARSSANTGRTACGLTLHVNAPTISNTDPKQYRNWWLPQHDPERPPSWFWPEYGRPAEQ